MVISRLAKKVLVISRLAKKVPLSLGFNNLLHLKRGHVLPRIFEIAIVAIDFENTANGIVTHQLAIFGLGVGKLVRVVDLQFLDAHVAHFCLL